MCPPACEDVFHPIFFYWLFFFEIIYICKDVLVFFFSFFLKGCFVPREGRLKNAIPTNLFFNELFFFILAFLSLIVV